MVVFGAMKDDNPGGASQLLAAVEPMYEELSKHKSSSFASFAVDFDPVFGTQLLEAMAEVSSFDRFAELKGTAAGGQLVCNSEEMPKWQLQMHPHRLFVTCSSLQTILERDGRRELVGLVQRTLQRLQITKIKRLGFQVTSFARQEGEFLDFAKVFSDQVFRSPLANLLGIEDLDPMIKLNGKLPDSGLVISSSIAPMSREQVMQALRSSPVHALTNSDPFDESLRTFLGHTSDTNLFVETDSGREGCDPSTFRDDFEEQIAVVDTILATTKKFLSGS